MPKDNTKAIRFDDNELSLINEYKLKYNMKTESDSIRQLIKDGLTSHNIGNKSIINYLQDVIDDESIEYVEDVTYLGFISIKNIASALLNAIGKIKNLRELIDQYFIELNYRDFLKLCFNDKNFLSKLEVALLDQTTMIYKYVSKTDQPKVAILRSSDILCATCLTYSDPLKFLNSIDYESVCNELQEMINSISYNKIRNLTYMYENEIIRDEYEIINMITYLKHIDKPYQDSQAYQYVKDLYELINDLYGKTKSMPLD